MKVRGKGFQEYIPFSVALKNALSHVSPLPPHSVVFHNAHGLVLAEDIVATEDVPSFDRSAVDGYAVRASDTYRASQNKPAVLRIASKRKRLKKGEAMEVTTGDPLPSGADAVVMLEHTIVRGDILQVLRPLAPGRNVSRKGEDVKKGELIMRAGTLLRPQEIGMLAQLRKLKVRVHPLPRVSLITTGDELVSPWKVEKNKTIDVNSYSLSSAVSECGAHLVSMKRVSDDPKLLEKELLRITECDLIIISGGTSVGKRDYAPECVQRLGKLIFHGVSMRPASPTAFGLIEGMPVFCLPGFPVASLLAFHVFVKPVIMKLRGLPPQYGKKTVKALLTSDVGSTVGRTDILRVKIRKAGKQVLAEPMRITGSGILSSLVNADGFVLIPENIEGLRKGESVEVELF